jgi:hypothetical protein
MWTRLARRTNSPGDCLAFQLAGKKQFETRLEASCTIYTSTIE